MILSYTPGTAKCSSPAATKTSPVSARENDEPTFVPSLPLRRRPVSATRVPQAPREPPRGPHATWCRACPPLDLRYPVATVFGGSRRGRQTGVADRAVRLAPVVGRVARRAARLLRRGVAQDRQEGFGHRERHLRGGPRRG